MADLSARESCDTTYHDAQSAAGDGTKQDQHSEPSAAQEGSVASETPYNAEWLSDLIGHLWNPELRKAFEKVAWDLLPDLLQKSSPPWMHSIKLTRFVLGHSPPVITNVSSFRDNKHEEDWTVAIECDVTWESKMDIELHIKPMPKQVPLVPDAVTKLLSNAVMFSAGVEKLKIKGRGQVIFNPLIPRLPVVAAVKAGFIEQPEVVDFTVTVMGGATLAGLIPSLKAWLVRFARDAILSHYVLPEQWCFRLDPEVEDINVPDGMLSVTVIEAKNIPKADYLSNSDPYIALWLRPTQRRQTSIQPQGKNATWNEHFHLPVDVAKRQKLVVVLYDHDTIGSDDELGRLLVPVSGLTDGQEKDVWLDLQDPKEEIKEGQRERQHDPVAEATKQYQHHQKHKAQKCQVRLKLRYHSLSRDEMSAIAKAQKEHDMESLYIHPKLRDMANQGVINIKLAFADKLVAGSWWRGPRKQLQVKCMLGTANHKRTLIKYGKRHSCRIDETVQLQVTSHQLNGNDSVDEIVLEVRERKWWQNSLEGKIVVRLQDLKQQGTLKARADLQGGKSTNGRLAFEMEWRSYLGIDSAEKQSAQQH